jgi:hypothetical protein
MAPDSFINGEESAHISVITVSAGLLYAVLSWMMHFKRHI